ncbi:hypothetical protein IAU59_003117 [Kwoniella sp. CBS 9459]
MSASTADPVPVPIPPFLASILSNHLVPAATTSPSNPSTTSGLLYGSKPGQSSHSGPAGSSTSNTSPSPSLFPTTTQIHIVEPEVNPATNSTSTGSTNNPAPVPPPNALYLPPPALPNLEEDLVPPENFALVAPGVYRCGFPKKRNFGFMETLRLKTVLTLVLEDYPEANLEWCQSQDIQFMQFGIPGNKEPFDNIPEDVICSALVAILDVRNHPVLIHCNKGKHRTGCLIGCIRRLQSWSLTSIFDEYRRFSSPKSRAVDQQFIDLFDIAPVWEQVTRPSKSMNAGNSSSREGAGPGGAGGIKSGGAGGGLENLPKWDMLTIPKRGWGLGMGIGGGVGSHLYANSKRERECASAGQTSKPNALDPPVIPKILDHVPAAVSDRNGVQKPIDNVSQPDGDTEGRLKGSEDGDVDEGVGVGVKEVRPDNETKTISTALDHLNIGGGEIHQDDGRNGYAIPS